MNTLENIKKKIEHIEELLAEIKREVEAITKESKSRHTKTAESGKAVPSDEELRSEYDRLYQDFISSNSGVVEDFIKSKSKSYLKAFCRANNLPVDIKKVSKAGIVDVVFQWMAQRKAITQRAV
jgi:actin-related protein